jgi:hypothetical protein
VADGRAERVGYEAAQGCDVGEGAIAGTGMLAGLLCVADPHARRGRRSRRRQPAATLIRTCRGVRLRDAGPLPPEGYLVTSSAMLRSARVVSAALVFASVVSQMLPLFEHSTAELSVDGPAQLGKDLRNLIT